MKTHVLMISRVFPSTHPRKGEPTNFYQQIVDEVKLHTVRGNYDWWAKKIDEVSAGDAVLEIRCWGGKPYNSPQATIATLDKTSGLGYERVDIFAMPNRDIGIPIAVNHWVLLPLRDFATNDGLTLNDFNAWFGPKAYAGIIIHFTQFRYLNQIP